MASRRQSVLAGSRGSTAVTAHAAATRARRLSVDAAAYGASQASSARSSWEPGSDNSAFAAAVRKKLAEVELLVLEETARWQELARQSGASSAPEDSRNLADLDLYQAEASFEQAQSYPMPQLDNSGGYPDLRGAEEVASPVWHETDPPTEANSQDACSDTPRGSDTPKTPTRDSGQGADTPKESGRARSKLTQVIDVASTGQEALIIPEGDESIWERLKTDNRFRMLILDSVMGVFILLNAAVLGLSCDLYQGWFGWVVIDGIFCVVFTAELSLKLCVAGWRGYLQGIDRRWNIFEAALVLLAIVEFATNVLMPAGGTSTKNLSLLRISRLTRITRLVRVCRLEMFADLMMMIKGALGGVKTLLGASVLLAMPLYALSIGFRETVGVHQNEGMGAESFATVPEAFFTIFRCTVGSECTDHFGRPIFALVASTYGWGYAFVFCIVELLLTFGLFNVIVAIFIENVLAGAKTNEQVMKRQRLQDQAFFASKMTELVAVIMRVIYEQRRRSSGGEARREYFPTTPEELLQSAAGMEITPEILEDVCSRDGVAEIFSDLAIADEDIFNLFETLDADGSGTIDMEELFEGIAKLRGDARRSDIIAINFMLQNVYSELREFRLETSALGERHRQTTLSSPSKSSNRGNASSGEGPAAAAAHPRRAAVREYCDEGIRAFV